MVLAELWLHDMVWTAIWVFFLVMFIWIFITVLSDLFRDDTLSGGAKALWVIVLIILPLLGSLAYLVARGQGMAVRSAEQRRLARAEFDSYIRMTAASTGAGPVDDLTRLADLHSRGVINDSEFEAFKARLTGATTAP